MNQSIRFTLAVAIGLLVTEVASGANVTYDVTVDTSSLNGTTGAVDFTLGSGLTSLPSTVTVSGISPLAGVGPGTISGDASGSLNPGPLTINNSTGYNDFFAQFTFTKSLSFAVQFSGLGVSSPDAAHFPDGSTFAFSIFDHSSNPMGTNPFGFLVTLDLNSDGTETGSTFSPAATINPVVPVAGVPEPNILPNLAVAIASMALARRRLTSMVR